MLYLLYDRRHSTEDVKINYSYLMSNKYTLLFYLVPILYFGVCVLVLFTDIYLDIAYINIYSCCNMCLYYCMLRILHRFRPKLMPITELGYLAGLRVISIMISNYFFSFKSTCSTYGAMDYSLIGVSSVLYICGFGYCCFMLLPWCVKTSVSW